MCPCDWTNFQLFTKLNKANLALVHTDCMTLSVIWVYCLWKGLETAPRTMPSQESVLSGNFIEYCCLCALMRDVYKHHCATPFFTCVSAVLQRYWLFLWKIWNLPRCPCNEITKLQNNLMWKLYIMPETKRQNFAQRLTHLHAFVGMCCEVNGLWVVDQITLLHNFDLIMLRKKKKNVLLNTLLSPTIAVDARFRSSQNVLHQKVCSELRYFRRFYSLIILIAFSLLWKRIRSQFPSNISKSGVRYKISWSFLFLSFERDAWSRTLCGLKKKKALERVPIR